MEIGVSCLLGRRSSHVTATTIGHQMHFGFTARFNVLVQKKKKKKGIDPEQNHISLMIISVNSYPFVTQWHNKSNVIFKQQYILFIYSRFQTDCHSETVNNMNCCHMGHYHHLLLSYSPCTHQARSLYDHVNSTGFS